MSTEAEIVEYAGRRYRVAGKSGPGVEPKPDMVMQWQAGDPYLLGPYLPLNAFAQAVWNAGNHNILLPIDASPPAETPRCEAPEWCGLPLLDRRVPGGTYFYTCGRASEKVPCGGHPCPCNSYCSPACADRARAAASNTTAAAPNTAPNIASPKKPESRAERWKRTHPGYSRSALVSDLVVHCDGDMARVDEIVQSHMVGLRRTACMDGATWEDATNRKPAPWAPSDPDGDIPNAWE